MSLYGRYFRLFRPYLRTMTLAIGLAVVTTSLQAVSLHLLADIVDLVAADAKSADFPITSRLLEVSPLFPGIPVRLDEMGDALRIIGVVIVVIVGLSFVKGILVYGKSYLLHRITYRVAMGVRNRLYDKILSLPIGVIARQRTGDLMARSVDDVNVLTQSVHAFSNVLQSSVTVLVFVTIMVMKSWLLTLSTLVFVPIVALLIQQLGVRIRRSSVQLQRELGGVAARLQEGITGLKVLKGFGAEREESARFQEGTQGMYRTAMRRVRVFSLQSPLTEIVLTFGMVGIFAVGFLLIVRGTLSFGDLLFHLALAGVLVEPIKSVGNFNALFQQGLASVARIEEVMALPSEDMTTGDTISDVRGDLEFENVTFRYDDGDTPVLRDISFSVKAGETVALVGRSGAGKTTLLQLIPRFYEPTAGRILLDGVPTDTISLASLRSHMAVVPQETLLFAGTIAENIRLAKPSATDAEVEEAARRAYAHDFIVAFPDGYETRLGERGVRLSGGQQQRIAIARAFLKNPRVFLFDEATAALDSESEAAIRRSFDELLRDRTAIVIAHRLSTVRDADLILVIDDGRIVESGDHASLLAQNGVYARFYARQFEEAAV